LRNGDTLSVRLEGRAVTEAFSFGMSYGVERRRARDEVTDKKMSNKVNSVGSGVVATKMPELPLVKLAQNAI
jgi:hypothetical protein